MKHWIEANRRELYFPESINLEDFVPVDHPARAIAAMVDALDTSAIEAAYDMEGSGRSPYHPRLLLSVGLLALEYNRFSLRKMEADLAANWIYRWLAGNKKPDHSTFGLFFTAQAELIADLFTQVVILAIQNGLVDFQTLAVDSMKLRADASYKQFRSEEGFAQEEAKIKEKIRALISAAVTGDKDNTAEVERLKKRELALNAARDELRRRAQEARDAGKKEPQKINVTDPDCYPIKQANGEKNAGYSVTTATDAANDIIVGFTVQVGGMNDAASLLPVLETCAENCGERHGLVVADPGFASLDNYERLEKINQDALIPDHRLDVEERNETAKGMYDRSRFKYDETRNVYECPQGQTLEHAETVQVNGRLSHRYRNRSACDVCPYRKKCTVGAFRTICRDDKEEFRTRMRERLAQAENKKLYSERAHACEAPYGDIKSNHNFTSHKRRGLLKIMMEDALLFMLHNGKKLFGTAPPVAALT